MTIPLQQLGNRDASRYEVYNDSVTVEADAPVRVAFLTPSLEMGGAERWMVSMAKHCDPMKVQWVGTALSPGASAKPELTSQLVNYMPLLGPAEKGDHDSPDIQRFASMEEVLKRIASNADVIVTWGFQSVGRFTDELDLPIVYVSHSSGGWTAEALQSSESQCTHYAAVSETAKAPFSEDIRSQVRILHNGIETDRCQVTVSRTAYRHQRGIPEQAVAIGYVGRFSYEKNPLAAALAVKRLQNPNVCAVYCGEGRRESDVMSDVRSLVSDQAVFIPFQEDVGNVLNALDVTVLASPAEGFSLGLAESWYCGTAAMATRVGAVPELEEAFGQLVAAVPQSPSSLELIAGIEEALSDRFQSEVVPRAKQMVGNHFTAERMADRWDDFLVAIKAEIGSDR